MRLGIAIVLVFVLVYGLYAGWESQRRNSALEQESLGLQEKVRSYQQRLSALEKYPGRGIPELDKIYDRLVFSLQALAGNEGLAIQLLFPGRAKKDAVVISDEDDGLESIRLEVSLSGLRDRAMVGRVIAVLSQCAREGPFLIERLFQRKDLLTVVLVIKGR